MPRLSSSNPFRIFRRLRPPFLLPGFLPSAPFLSTSFTSNNTTLVFLLILSGYLRALLPSRPLWLALTSFLLFSNIFFFLATLFVFLIPSLLGSIPRSDCPLSTSETSAAGSAQGRSARSPPYGAWRPRPRSLRFRSISTGGSLSLTGRLQKRSLRLDPLLWFPQEEPSPSCCPAATTTPVLPFLPWFSFVSWFLFIYFIALIYFDFDFD